MSKSIVNILMNFKELESGDPNSELITIKTDIDIALREIQLTEAETAVLNALFTVDVTPERNRENRLGGISGRPVGGLQRAIARYLSDGSRSENAEFLRVSKLLRGISGKLRLVLGSEYA